ARPLVCGALLDDVTHHPVVKAPRGPPRHDRVGLRHAIAIAHQELAVRRAAEDRLRAGHQRPQPSRRDHGSKAADVAPVAADGPTSREDCAARATESTSSDGSVFSSSDGRCSSTKPVCRSPVRNRGGSSVRIRSATLVLTPRMGNCRNAATARAIAASRVSPLAISFASIGSYWTGNAVPSSTPLVLRVYCPLRCPVD